MPRDSWYVRVSDFSQELDAWIRQFNRDHEIPQETFSRDTPGNPMRASPLALHQALNESHRRSNGVAYITIHSGINSRTVEALQKGQRQFTEYRLAEAILLAVGKPELLAGVTVYKRHGNGRNGNFGFREVELELHQESV